MDRKLVWWIFAVSKGGHSRSRIVKILKDRPSSISQLAKDLGLTYHDTRYHIKILQENKIIESIGDASIAMYFLTEEFEKNWWEEFEKIWKSLDLS